MNIRKFFGLSTAVPEQKHVWDTDAQLRRFALNQANRKNELMADDMAEFFRAIDEYNMTADDGEKVRVEIRRELSLFLQQFIDGTAPRSQMGGLAHADGMRVHIGRAAYDAVYFNDMVFNTGLNLYRPGAEKKAGSFLFGLSPAMDFGAFVRTLGAPENKPRRGWLFGPR